MDRGITMSHTVVGVHPGASTAAKRWPLERFCAVATALSAGPGIRVLTFVDPGGYGDDLRDVPASVSAKVDLRQMIALLQCCTVLVCNDSGPMHLAGGLNIPTVAVFGKGIAQWFAPLGSGHEVVSASGTANPGVATDPATTDSLGDVAVASVLEAAQRVLSRSRAARTLTSDGSRSHR